KPVGYLSRLCSSVDMCSELRVKPERGRERRQELLFGRRIVSDGDACSRVELNAFLRRLDRSGQVLNRPRTIELFGQECLGLTVEARLLQAAHDLVLLAGIDASVGEGSRDHRLNVMYGSFVRDRRRLEAGT